MNLGPAALSPGTVRPEIARLELSLLLDGVKALTGYDLEDYAPVPLRRRISERLRAEGVSTIVGLLERVLYDPDAARNLVDSVCARIPDPFADVEMLHSLRSYIVRWLRTFPTVRVWVAGNSIDAFAMAIAFKEEDLGRRIRIYATEPTQSAVERAKEGLLDPDQLWAAEKRYLEAGGRFDLGRYLQRDGGNIRFSDDLRGDLVFSRHHLPTDGSFNEFQLIVASGIGDTYAPAAAYRAHRTIYQSLALFGLTFFGSTARLSGTPHAQAYEEAPACEGLFRRIR